MLALVHLISNGYSHRLSRAMVGHSSACRAGACRWHRAVGRHPAAGLHGCSSSPSTREGRGAPAQKSWALHVAQRSQATGTR